MTFNVRHQACMRGEPNATRMTGHAPTPRPMDELVHVVHGTPMTPRGYRGWLVLPCELDILRYVRETDEPVTCLECLARHS